ELLRKKGVAKAAKRADREAGEGVVTSYIHAGGRIGSLVELNCETDFVAKTDDFKNLASEIAKQLAAMNPEYATVDAVPADVIEKEKEVMKAQLEKEGKPQEVIEKIIVGKLEKFYEENVLLKQKFYLDDKKTIEDLINEAIAKLGENIKIGRIARFQIK
ncbi:elongation factor Ts, partial [bacterium]|nr:elongation factor Ts [bacterium]